MKPAVFSIFKDQEKDINAVKWFIKDDHATKRLPLMTVNVVSSGHWRTSSLKYPHHWKFWGNKHEFYWAIQGRHKTQTVATQAYLNVLNPGCFYPAIEPSFWFDLLHSICYIIKVAIQWPEMIGWLWCLKLDAVPRHYDIKTCLSRKDVELNIWVWKKQLCIFASWRIIWPHQKQVLPTNALQALNQVMLLTNKWFFHPGQSEGR